MKTHLELAKLFNSISNWDTIGTDTQYKVLDYPDEVVIIFCPSNSKADWRINFNFPRKPYKRMKTPFYVHGGFLVEWKKINDHFLKVAAAYNKPITVCGWSYGGAIATLCMEDIWFNYPEKRDTLKLITLGSPRVIGWRNYRKIKERWSNTINYCNRIDIVTNVPFFLMGFAHVKKKTYINRDKSPIQFFKFVNNHMVDQYEQGIKKEGS